MQNAPQSHQNDRLGPESPQRDALFRNFSEAQEIHLRLGLLLEDAEEQKVELQRHKTGRRVRMRSGIRWGNAVVRIFIM